MLHTTGFANAHSYEFILATGFANTLLFEFSYPFYSLMFHFGLL